MKKKNLLKIPPRIIERIRSFDQDDIVVACVKRINDDNVSAYSQLGLAIKNSEIILPSPQIPSPKYGRYSKANVEGYEKVRRDLPKEPKEFSVDAPNWRGNGTHTVSRTRLVYPREFFPPKEVELSATLVQKNSDGSYSVKFSVEQVINRRTNDFEKELLYNLNILQENIGAIDVFMSATTLEEYAKTVRVDWIILPPGQVEDIVRQMLRNRGNISAEREQEIKDRVAVMADLEPTAYIAGTDGFVRYFGAQFGEDFVAFENANYGNAIYVLHDSWKELSKKSRIELLNRHRDSFERILHTQGWEDRLRRLVLEYRQLKEQS